VQGHSSGACANFFVSQLTSRKSHLATFCFARDDFSQLLAKYNQSERVAPGTIALNCSERD